MESVQKIRESETYVMNTYKRFPLVLRKGRGVDVEDTDGRLYLDFIGGIATNVLGHCHPKVVVAVQKQAQRLIHVSNLFHNEPQIELAKLLVLNSFADRVFFCNSGTEANEAAIKLARKYSIEHFGPARTQIITAERSFHGRTLGSLSATGQEKLKLNFGPMPGNIVHVPFDNTDAIERAITKDTCAVMIEPILGESGVIVPSEDYLNRVREICNRHELLLILDEIQTGFGRTGKLFAYEHSEVVPDIMTLAKGLGAGVPIGAMLATERVAASFVPGDHGSTFGGNPLACAAAVATLETLLEDGILLEQCERLGAYLMNSLEGLKKKYPLLVREIRGRGLLVGMELERECAPYVKVSYELGLLINCTSLNVLRFMPPLIVEQKDIDRAVAIVDEVLSSVE